MYNEQSIRQYQAKLIGQLARNHVVHLTLLLVSDFRLPQIPAASGRITTPWTKQRTRVGVRRSFGCCVTLNCECALEGEHSTNMSRSEIYETYLWDSSALVGIIVACNMVRRKQSQSSDSKSCLNGICFKHCDYGARHRLNLLF